MSFPPKLYHYSRGMLRYVKKPGNNVELNEIAHMDNAVHVVKYGGRNRNAAHLFWKDLYTLVILCKRKLNAWFGIVKTDLKLCYST